MPRGLPAVEHLRRRTRGLLVPVVQGSFLGAAAPRLRQATCLGEADLEVDPVDPHVDVVGSARARWLKPLMASVPPLLASLVVK